MPYRTKESAVAHRAAVRKSILELQDKVFKKLGNKCVNPACQWLNADGSRGCANRACMQIDHVYGDGAKERRQHLTQRQFLHVVLQDVEGRYQILCANCNWIKRRAERRELEHA